MTTTIALAGKGGTGKTTVAALLIRYIVERGLGTILAIDADPSANLNLSLGVPLDGTVGDIREEMLSQVSGGTMNLGISKHDYLDYHIRTILEEGDVFDLLAMGRPEGPGCYCPVNNMLRLIIDRLSKNYNYVVIDNEAGMEHLSRRTTRDVDFLLLVTDPTLRGVAAAKGMVQLSQELNINVGQTYLVVNRVGESLPRPVQEAIEELGIELLGTIPYDPQLMVFEGTGRPLLELDGDSAVYRAVKKIADKLIPRTGG
ncbi:MAG: AAA family ATPase [Anaerolineae bacterium]